MVQYIFTIVFWGSIKVSYYLFLFGAKTGTCPRYLKASFLLSTFLRNFFPCQDRWHSDTFRGLEPLLPRTEILHSVFSYLLLLRNHQYGLRLEPSHIGSSEIQTHDLSIVKQTRCHLSYRD